MLRRLLKTLLYCIAIIPAFTGCANLFSGGQKAGSVDASPIKKDLEEKPVKTVIDARRYKLVLPREIPEMGYVKFFRTGLEDFSPRLKVYQVYYGSQKLLGEIKNDRPLCIKIREGFTMFKIITENGMVDREVVKVNTDKIKPLEAKFAWDAGYRYSHNLPYRWDMIDKHPYTDFDPEQCRPVLVE
ncbi:MAG: hypothetical protein OEV64_00750 [Desulfobulbaceae bacterium]|nr:hypothetical protein [Desulfobulbaceae bacterium]